MPATSGDGWFRASHTRGKQHLAAAHPDRADEYEREHILFMALDVPDPPN